MQYNQEDERVEKTLEATLSDVEFDHYDDSPTRRMPELLTQSGGAKEKPAWHPTVRLQDRQNYVAGKQGRGIPVSLQI